MPNCRTRNKKLYSCLNDDIARNSYFSTHEIRKGSRQINQTNPLQNAMFCSNISHHLQEMHKLILHVVVSSLEDSEFLFQTFGYLIKKTK